LLGAYIVLRLGFVFSMSSVASAALACVGGALALSFALMAARALDLRRIVACLGVAELGLVLLGLGAGAPPAAALELVLYAASAGALWMCVAAVEAGPGVDLRVLGGLAKKMPAVSRIWFLTSLGLVAAPIPGLAGFWTKNAVLGAAFTTLGTARIPGWLLFALGAAACGVASFAAWRAYFAVFVGKAAAKQGAAEDPGGSTNTAAWLLGVLAAFGGAVLGFGGHFTGAKGQASILAEWLEPVTRGSAGTFAPTSPVVEWGLAAVFVGVALAGWSTARARYGEKRADDWAEREGKRAGESTKAAETRTPAPAEIAHGTERWVLDGFYAVAGGATRAAAFVANLVDDQVLGAGLDTLADRSSRFDARTRIIGAAVLVLVVALALYLVLHRP
jgi:NADH-quinone oxidoreductase subunit L